MLVARVNTYKVRLIGAGLTDLRGVLTTDSYPNTVEVLKAST